MRLICPTCAIEYEIDADAIGAGGRKVRCADCGTEWFQRPRSASLAEAVAAVEKAARNRQRPDGARETVIAPETPAAPEPPEAPAIDGEASEETSPESGPAAEPRRANEGAPDDAFFAARSGGAEPRSGAGAAFLAGFMTVALLALILAALYVERDEIAGLAPALEPHLAAYADLVDRARGALAELIGRL
ncbi:zinc-ribbon domain-containing protein [Pikeienuella sp. HZG-20]|uniref:zinc-ribbon domain-containing protein n=1 Tax=Paludibacillus litoralis TaxID=3133267 RepID=UPI0030EE8D8B